MTKSKPKQIRFCDVCGVSNETGKRVNNISKVNMCLCSKHHQQFIRFGKFTDSNQQTVDDPNKIVLFDDHAEVECYDNHGNVSGIFLIDLEDVEIAKRYKWRVTFKYGKPYIVAGNNRKVPITYFARLVMNAPTGIEVDHKDGNTLNNRKNNLRFADRAIQTSNLAPRRTNKIGVRGVSYSNRDNVYKVDFIYNKDRYYPKPFQTVEEAVYARYLLELKVNPFRYTSNDDYIMTFIDRLSDEQKVEIEAYIDNLIHMKAISNNYNNEIKELHG